MPSVLLIEDEPPLARLVVWALIEEGFAVAAVAHCADALLRLESFRPDVIVFNTVMIDDDRNACVDALRLSSPGSRIVDVSGEKNSLARGMIEPARDGVRADAHLGMPFPTERLVELLRKQLAN